MSDNQMLISFSDRKGLFILIPILVGAFGFVLRPFSGVLIWAEVLAGILFSIHWCCGMLVPEYCVPYRIRIAAANTRVLPVFTARAFQCSIVELLYPLGVGSSLFVPGAQYVFFVPFLIFVIMLAVTVNLLLFFDWRAGDYPWIL